MTAATVADVEVIHRAAPIACVRCGFEFYQRTSESRCDDCQHHDQAPRESTRPSAVLVLQLAGEVATLRLAVEAARRRIGMAIHGHEIGRDSLTGALMDADEIMRDACQVYTRLSVTRPYDEGPALPAQRRDDWEARLPGARRR